MQQWLEREYPAIHSQARQEKALIHWGDEMGVGSDYQAGCTYAQQGQTPLVLGTGQRFRCNMISSITNRGKLSFKLFEPGFSADVMLDFLRRLIRLSSQKVFLIVDPHPVHRSKRVTQWLEKHAEQIRIFFLASYSRELNPDE